MVSGVDSRKVDLKKIERKAYLSYHQDGLLEIVIGLFILVFGVGMATDTASYMGGIGALGIPLYAVAKKAITIPRIGYVKFGSARRIRMKREKTFFMIFLTATVLGGLVMFLCYHIVASGSHNWLKRFLMAPMGLIGAICLSFLAYWKQVGRYYAYAVLILVGVFIGPLLSIPHPVYFSLPGAVILLFGIAMLIRFLRKYPKVAEEVSDDKD